MCPSIHPSTLSEKAFKSKMDLGFPPYQKFVKLLYSQVQMLTNLL